MLLQVLLLRLLCVDIGVLILVVKCLGHKTATSIGRLECLICLHHQFLLVQLNLAVTLSLHLYLLGWCWGANELSLWHLLVLFAIIIIVSRLSFVEPNGWPTSRVQARNIALIQVFHIWNFLGNLYWARFEDAFSMWATSPIFLQIFLSILLD